MATVQPTIEFRPQEASEVSELAGLRPYVRRCHEEFRPPWHLGERKLLDFLVVYVESGRGWFRVGERHDTVADEPAIIWIPPDTPHEMCGTSEKMHLVFAHFDLLFDLRRSLWDAHVPPGVLSLAPYANRLHPKVRHVAMSSWRGRLDLPNAAAVGATLKRMAAGSRRQAHPLFLGGLLCELVAEILWGRKVAGEPESRHYAALQAAATEIHGRLDQPLRLDRLAERADLSEPHFRRLFKALFGCGPREMHTRARMHKPCDLLSHSRQSVTRTASGKA